MFGNGHDLSITGRHGSLYLDCSYKCPPDLGDEQRRFFTGSRRFQITNYEVFGIRHWLDDKQKTGIYNIREVFCINTSFYTIPNHRFSKNKNVGVKNSSSPVECRSISWLNEINRNPILPPTCSIHPVIAITFWLFVSSSDPIFYRVITNNARLMLSHVIWVTSLNTSKFGEHEKCLRLNSRRSREYL